MPAIEALTAGRVAVAVHFKVREWLQSVAVAPPGVLAECRLVG
jgi:hypothetical protein